MDPYFKVVGVAYGAHGGYRHMLVMDLAGGFEEKESGDPVKESHENK